MAKRKVILASGTDAVGRFPIGTVFIIIGDIGAKLSRSRFGGALVVARAPGLTNIVLPLDFAPLEPLKTLVTEDDFFSRKDAWHVELREGFQFFTEIREANPCAHLSDLLGVSDALDILLAVNEMSLDDLTMTPQGDKHRVHDDIEASLAKWMGYEDEALSAVMANRLALQLTDIPIGKEGAAAFENWCHQVITLLFKGRCDPVYIRPNGSAADRRDIVATNIGESVFCKRILRDYGARHVHFEVKNSSDIDVDALRQVSAYTGSSYGRIGFLISRADSEGLDRRLRWQFRNMHHKGTLIVQLSTAFLLNVLGIVSRCEGRCAVEREFVMLLDKYLLEYANEPPPGATAR